MAGPPQPNEYWGCYGDNTERLQGMSLLPSMAGPGNPYPDVVPGDPQSYLDSLRQYAYDQVPGELLDSQKDIWATDPEKKLHTWMYLQAPTAEKHLSFIGWIDVIKKDLKCDDRACGAFVRLFKMAPAQAPHGFMEASRVLAHTLKDKMKNLEEYDPYRPPRDDWSRFLQNACEEAIEALETPEEVKTLPRRNTGGYKGFGKKGPEPPGPPGPPGYGASSSSSSWSTPGGGKGFKGPGGGKGFKGPDGKGKYMQQGHRPSA